MIVESIGGVKTLVALAAILSIGLSLFVGPYLTWRKLRRREQEVKRHEDAGTIGPASAVQGQFMPVHYDLIAGIGTSGPAGEGLNERVLKPSLGAKLFALLFWGSILYLLLTQPIPVELFLPMPNGLAGQDTDTYAFIIRTVLLFLSAIGVAYFFTFETRYDRVVLIVTRLGYFRNECRWKNLRRVAYDEGFSLVLFFEPGGKVSVLKYSAGIEEFKAFALAQIQRSRANA